ncbi:hypothetical protein YTPLAS18_00760 [Nitrospira sp.]|nr:hypothetical protein YTPLAS18_00760 [Nitrospira sp.]
MPIELSRVSSDRRLTLVIDEDNGIDTVTRYAFSSRTNTEYAVDDLSRREGTTQACIGFVDLVNGTANPTKSTFTSLIWEWAETAGVGAVVWTALATNFHQKIGEQFSAERGMACLKGLNGAKRDQALDYFCKAPEEVNRSLRRALQVLEAY